MQRNSAIRLLLLAGALTQGALAPTPAFAQRDDGPPSVVVVGEGVASAAPNTAEVRAGVVTEASTAAAAVEANNKAMNRVMESLSAAGIPAKDVQTESLSVTPRHRSGSQGRRDAEIVGYVVTNRVRLVVRDLDRMGTILDDLVRQGANQLYGVQFSGGDPAQLIDEARGKAMADARRKADLYTQAAGVRVGRVLRIEEGFVAEPRPRVMRSLAAVGEAGMPVAPGELDFPARVTVTYEIKER